MNSIQVASESVSTAEVAIPRTIIVSRRCGRLANRLVLFANLIAHANCTGSRIINPTFYTYANHFESFKDNLLHQYPPPNSRFTRTWTLAAKPILRTKMGYHVLRHTGQIVNRFPMMRSRACAVHEPADGSVMDLDSPQFAHACGDATTVFLYGWAIRATRSVARSGHLIRDYFRPIEIHRSAAEKLIYPLRGRSDVVIGVHMRQGDYRRWLNGKFFFPTSRYALWMQEIVGAFPGKRVGFFVCGDEQHDASEFPTLDVQCGGSHLVVDLHTLSMCDYVIGPLSTFSQWASFSGNVPLMHLRHSDDVIDPNTFSVSDLEFLPF